MLFGNVSIAHYSPSNLFLWFIMAFQAGLLNIGGFFVARKIVSHVTGFATFFGQYIALKNLPSALGMLIVPCFFLLGAMVSGFFVDVRINSGKKPKYYITFGIMFFLNLVVLVTGLLGGWGEFAQYPLSDAAYLLLVILCFLCGIQNGTISTVSRSVVRTTHLTGITTDLGLGIMRMLYRDRLNDVDETEGQANFMRIGIILSFTLGAVVGGFLFHHFQYLGFLLPVLISGGLFLLMMYFQVWKTNDINLPR